MNFLYDLAINGLPGSDTAEALANQYMRRLGPLEDRIDDLIRWQVTKCTASGFVTGFGGLITLPIAIPADFSANYYIQIRMVAAIAHMCGYDVRSDKVRALALACLAGNFAKEFVKDISLRAGARLFAKGVPLLGGIVGGTVDGAACRLVGKVAKETFLEKPKLKSTDPVALDA